MTPKQACGHTTDWTIEDCCAISVQQMLTEPHVYLRWDLPRAPKEIQQQILQQLRMQCLADYGRMQ